MTKFNIKPLKVIIHPKYFLLYQPSVVSLVEWLAKSANSKSVLKVTRRQRQPVVKILKTEYRATTPHPHAHYIPIADFCQSAR